MQNPTKTSQQDQISQLLGALRALPLAALRKFPALSVARLSRVFTGERLHRNVK
jgi:hypothetical protein